AAAPGDGTWLAAARSGGRAVLRAWRVPVLSFPAPAALPLLAGLGHSAAAGHSAGSDDALLPVGPDGELVDSADAAEEVIFGQWVPYLAACAALAADLAARGRLLPALIRLTAPDDPAGIPPPGPVAGQGSMALSYAARWRPVVSGADAQRVREL